MRLRALFPIVLAAVTSLSAKDSDVLASLQPLIAQVTQEFEQIPAERQQALKKVALFIRSKV